MRAVRDLIARSHPTLALVSLVAIALALEAGKRWC
jgi:hypothetical protein